MAFQLIITTYQVLLVNILACLVTFFQEVLYAQNVTIRQKLPNSPELGLHLAIRRELVVISPNRMVETPVLPKRVYPSLFSRI